MSDQNTATPAGQSARDTTDAGREPVRQVLRQDRLPGRRDALPAGALGGASTGPQGDENRDPPANAPVIPA
jgi:hypothetical protein